MEKTAANLERLISAGDDAGCCDFFLGMPEQERRSFAKTAEAAFKVACKTPTVSSAPGYFSLNPAICAGANAAFSCCSFSTLKGLGSMAIPFGPDLVAMLQDRRPDWCDQYAEYLIASDPIHWTIVRDMMNAGLCRKPQHDNYIVGMFDHDIGVGDRHHRYGPTHERAGERRSVMDHFLDEPDLLDDIWRIFEIEGGGEYSLATHDKYFGPGIGRWSVSLVELSRRGLLPRERLLDASLAALDRGFLQFRAGWFSAFHELLEPTLTERRSRADQYLSLLASPIPPTVSFALKAVDLVDQVAPLGSRRLIESFAPVLLARAKVTAKAGLKMLDRVASRDSAAAPLASLTAVKALLHEATDVQSAALTFLEKHGSVENGELRDAVVRHLDQMSALLRGRAQSWLHAKAGPDLPRQVKEHDAGTDGLDALRARAQSLSPQWRRLAGVDRALDALTDGRLELCACPFDGTDIPRLDPERQAASVSSLDELIDVAAAALENEDNDAIERVFDGVSRLCDLRPADFELRTGPLRKRCKQVLSRLDCVPFYANDLQAHLVGVLLAWICRETGRLRPTDMNTHPEYCIDGFVHQAHATSTKRATDLLGIRALHLAQRTARGKSQLLLSAPTHAGGWIAPTVMADRVLALRAAAVDDIDVALALLRLAPDGRDRALAKLKGVRGEIAAACRYALGGPAAPQAQPAWLWVAASRARSPWQRDERLALVVKNAGPDAAEPADVDFKIGGGKKLAFNIGDVKAPAPLRVIVRPELPKKIDDRLLTVQLWRHIVRDAGEIGEMKMTAAIRGAQSIWPLAMEAVCALGAQELAGNLSRWTVGWENRTYLEPLPDPDLPLRDMARLLLVIGLASKEPGEQGLAVDACIAAIGDRRLDGDNLGKTMGRLLPGGLITLSRWAASLGQVAQASALHAETIRTALDVSIQASPKQLPRDVQSLLTLLLELVHETGGSVSAETRAILSRLSGSSKAARAAKAILSCSGSPAPDRIAAIMQADVEARIIRAERWQSRAAKNDSAGNEPVRTTVRKGDG